MRPLDYKKCGTLILKGPAQSTSIPLLQFHYFNSTGDLLSQGAQGTQAAPGISESGLRLHGYGHDLMLPLPSSPLAFQRPEPLL